jgi:hypothetical protein
MIPSSLRRAIALFATKFRCDYQDACSRWDYINERERDLGD